MEGMAEAGGGGEVIGSYPAHITAECLIAKRKNCSKAQADFDKSSSQLKREAPFWLSEGTWDALQH